MIHEILKPSLTAGLMYAMKKILDFVFAPNRSARYKYCGQSVGFYYYIKTLISEIKRNSKGIRFLTINGQHSLPRDFGFEALQFIHEAQITYINIMAYFKETNLQSYLYAITKKKQISITNTIHILNLHITLDFT